MSELIRLSDEEWAVIGPLLPPERGRWSRPAADNRPFFEGMLWMARTGAQWRQLPSAYGKWNSVFRRYRRWTETGVFDAMLETLADMAAKASDAHMIDSTVVRAHHCAAGVKSRLGTPRRSAARAAASRPNSMHAATAKVGPSASLQRPARHMTSRASSSCSA